jgi:hypothetical protein
MPESNLADDLLIGAEAIAAFTGFSPRQVYRYAETGHLRTFKMGALVCARRSTITEDIARSESEAAARRNQQVAAAI